MVREDYLALRSVNIQFGRPIRLHVYIRIPRVLVDHFLGDKVEGFGFQDSDHSGNHCGGCHAVLPGYIHLPLPVLEMTLTLGKVSAIAALPTAALSIYCVFLRDSIQLVLAL